jgi:hypothetical protein
LRTNCRRWKTFCEEIKSKYNNPPCQKITQIAPKVALKAVAKLKKAVQKVKALAKMRISNRPRESPSVCGSSSIGSQRHSTLLAAV